MSIDIVQKNIRLQSTNKIRTFVGLSDVGILAAFFQFNTVSKLNIICILNPIRRGSCLVIRFLEQIKE